MRYLNIEIIKTMINYEIPKPVYIILGIILIILIIIVLMAILIHIATIQGDYSVNLLK